MASPDFRRSWRNWLASLRELADVDLQRRKLARFDQPESHWSFVEIIGGYFDQADDSGYGWAIENAVVTKEEAAIVEPLHRLLVAYEAPEGDDCDHKAVLDDPVWSTPTNVAKAVAERLAMTLIARPSEPSCWPASKTRAKRRVFRHARAYPGHPRRRTSEALEGLHDDSNC